MSASLFLTVNFLNTIPFKFKADNRHLVTRSYFRSRDKDGGHHIIRFVIAENPMVHPNFMAAEPELLPTEVLHCGIRDFEPFFSCDLELDPKHRCKKTLGKK